MSGEAVGRNFLALTIGQIVSRILAAAAVIYLARVLHAEAFGSIVFATAALSWFSILLNIGLDTLGSIEASRGTLEPRLLTGSIVLARLLMLVPLSMLIATFVVLIP